MTLQEINHIVEKFRDRTLPISEWTHQAHLVVGLWFSKHYTHEEAVCYLRSGIIAYNNAVGTENSPQKGYHETLTLFWAKVARDFVESHTNLDLESLCNTFLVSALASKEYPFQFYSREELFSTKARAFFVSYQ
jgi:hypothetical protein